MRIYLFPLLTLLVSATLLAQAGDWDARMFALGEKEKALTAEDKNIRDQIHVYSQQAALQEARISLLKARLSGLDDPQNRPELAKIPPETPRILSPAEKDLVEKHSASLALLAVGDKPAATIFSAKHEGKNLIFASTPAISGNLGYAIEKLDGEELKLTQALTQPVGVDILGFEPETEELPAMTFIGADETISIGERIVVLSVDLETRKALGTPGIVRGMGPDKMELAATLEADMSGAPVLSSKTGNIVGVIAPQVAGVTDEWAVGTRHEGSRDFATRVDTIAEWRADDRARFAREAAYVERINQKTRIAWIARNLLEIATHSGRYRSHPDHETLARYSQEARKRIRSEMERQKTLVDLVQGEATKFDTNDKIAKARKWINNYEAVYNSQYRAGRTSADRDARDRLEGFYASLYADLKKTEADLSAHLTPYHQGEYRDAMRWRNNELRAISTKTSRIGR